MRGLGLREWVALAIAVIWLGSYIIAVAEHDYTGLSLTTPVMLIAAGALLSNIGRKNGGG